MKNRIGVILLVVLSLGLLIGLVTVKKQAGEQQRTDGDHIQTLSNQLEQTSTKLEEQKQVAVALERDLASERKSYGELSNNLTQVSATLSQTAANLAKTESALKASQEEVAKRETRITELESQNQALDQKALELGSSITNLTLQIAATEKKLAASEGDKVFLQSELKRLTAEKAELERQFNDLKVLRAQVAKLKEELNIARRIDWIRRGLFANAEQKGAQQLVRGLTAPQPVQAKTTTTKPAYDLNVEVSADGSVKVVPPGSATNAAKPKP